MSNSFDGGALFRALPSSIHPILEYLETSGFSLILVGGATRDFILSKTLSHDLDFEIRYCDHYEGREWESCLTHLMETLGSKFNLAIENLPFGVFRFSLGEFDVELSSPRTETFITGQLGHSNFTVFLSSDLDYKKAYSRRDFTVNALGAKLQCRVEKSELIDPLNGIVALEKKLLIPCGNDFFHDPVRFLRLIRFGHNLGFELDEKISSALSCFDLSELSDFYIRSEAQKTGVLPFFKKLFNILDSVNIVPSSNISSLRFLATVESHESLNGTDNLIPYLVSKIDDCESRRLQELYKLKEKYMKSLREFFYLLRSVDFSWVKSKSSIDNIGDRRFLDFFKLSQLIERRGAFEVSYLSAIEAKNVLQIRDLINFKIEIKIPELLPRQDIGRYILFRKMEKLWRL
ncbi:MAG: hypothetical protein KAG61_06510 [Bacteriovoracaceae bacterium]|nr:hypothetical protein [Bacteriovoracaceae bacterium]